MHNQFSLSVTLNVVKGLKKHEFDDFAGTLFPPFDIKKVPLFQGKVNEVNRGSSYQLPLEKKLPTAFCAASLKEESGTKIFHRTHVDLHTRKGIEQDRENTGYHHDTKNDADNTDNRFSALEHGKIPPFLRLLGSFVGKGRRYCRSCGVFQTDRPLPIHIGRN